MPVPAPQLSLKPDVLHAGDFVYCRSKRYREQLRLPEEVGLVIEVKRSNFKVLYNGDQRCWLPRDVLVLMGAESNTHGFLATLHYLLKRVDAHECEIVSFDDVHRLSARIDTIDAAAVDAIRAYLGARFTSLVVVPEGMAFMQLEITFR
jgi:hypothetical protein